MNTFYKSFGITFLFIGAIGLASFAHAEEYNLSYGARLTEVNGAPILGQDGKLDLEVSFYNVGTGGSPIGPSPISFPGTSVAEGVFQLSITLAPTEFHQVFQDPSTPVYIEVKDVKSGAVFPRQRFSVIPFALKTPIDNDTIVYNSDGKLSVGSSVGTVKQITAGSGLTGGVITDSGTIAVDTGTTGNKIVQLSDSKLPSVDGSNLSGVNAEKLQTRSVSAAVPVSGQVLKWSGSAWVPSSDLVGETGSGEANTASNATSGSGVGLFKGKVSADLGFYSLSPGSGMTINLVGDDVVIASTITQYTDAMAKAAAVANSISDSVTNIAPSQNAVFDALATKQASVTTSTDLNLNSITTNAVNAITVNPGVSTGEIKLKELSVNGANYVGLKAPGSITSDLTFTLPGSSGTNGQFLKTDGSGNLSWTDQATAPVTSVNTLTGAVTLTTTNVTEGTNLYYSDARAKTATVGDAITDAVTDKAPSQNAVFDALALKSEASHNHSGVYEPAGLSADVVTTTKILDGAVTSAKIASGVDAAKVGGGAVDNTEFSYLNGVTSAIQTQLDGKIAGPASVTDNAIARFDGSSGKLAQNSGVVIDDSGNVGIGTTSPLMALAVSSGYSKTDTTTRYLQWLSTNDVSNPFGLSFGLLGAATNAERAAVLQTSNYGLDSLGNLVLQPDGGNVGIGTTNPLSNLEVVGSIGSKSLSWGVLSASSVSNVGTPHMIFLRARGSAFGSESAPLLGDCLGFLTFRAHNGTTYTGNIAGIAAGATENYTPSGTGSNLTLMTSPNGSSWATERMRIDQNGYVGIGTTSPSVKLDVNGTINATGLKFAGNNLVETANASGLATGAWYRIAQTNSTVSQPACNNFRVTWAQGSNGTALFNACVAYSSGAGTLGAITLLSQASDVAVGVSKLRIVYDPNALSNNSRAYVELYDNNALGISVESFDETANVIYHKGWTLLNPSSAGSIPSGFTYKELNLSTGGLFATSGNMLVSGNVGIGTTNPTQKLQVGTSGDGSVAVANAWNTFSDIRLKRDLVKLPEALNKLEELNGYYYFWKDGEDQSRQVGVVAQEVERVLPELVKTGQDGIKTVDYPKLTVLLIEAAKQLKADVEKFKNDNDAMKAVLCEIKPDAAFCAH